MPYIWLIIIALSALLFIYDYNKLIKLNQQAIEGWSGIDVQLKRRRDLIPELVKIASFYAKHEKGTFEAVAKLRANAETAPNVETLAKTESEISTSLKKIFAM